MSKTSAWSDPSRVSTQDVARMAAHLEDRGQRHDQLQVNNTLMDVLSPRPGEQLLDVGSGTGILSRLAAQDITPGGKIIALDISLQFNQFARERGVESGQAVEIELLTSTAERIPIVENSFDGAWAIRLMMHAAKPDEVVREIVRVVRPGGRLVLVDWDFETVVVDHPDRELTRKILRWRCDHYGGDNWSGRKLMRRSRSAGLKDVEIFPVSVTAFDEQAALTLSLWRAAEVARDGGAITSEEHDAWITILKERIQAGRFFAGITYYILKGWVS